MRRTPGFTLIEVLVTIIVIGISAVALLSVFTNLVRGSADPMIQQQAITIAEAYLEEISLRAFEDPDQPEGPGNLEGESGRSEFDDIKDYRSLAAAAPADQYGTTIPELANYLVTVAIVGAELNTIAAETDSVRIDVTVTHPAMSAITLSAYRSRWPPP